MATEQTLEIKYLVKVIDDASRNLENIEKELQLVIKTNKNVEKANQALTESFKEQSKSIQNTEKDINQANTNLNKYKTALAAVALAGTQFYYSIYNKEIFTAFNLAVLNAGEYILKISEKFGQAILSFKQGDSILLSLGSRISSVFLIGKKYLDDFGKVVVNSAFDLARYNTFGELAAEGIFKISDASNAAGQKIREIITNAQPLQQVSSSFLQLAKDTGPLNAALTKLNQVFQLLIKTFPQFFNIVQLGFDYLGKQSFVLGIKAQGAAEELSKLAATGKNVGSSIAEAAKRTEPLQSGLIATASKATLLAGVFTALGTALITSDSIMAKIAGITLLGLSIALAGLAVVIQQVLTYMGKFITNIGEKLVASMHEATKAASQAQQQLFTFKFIIDSLNNSTDGATGSFSEWSDVVDQFSESTKFMTGDVQQSVSEILRFGNSIGLSKDQMKRLLPVIGDLARANHKDLFSSTLAVLEGLNGQTQSLQTMGVNLTQATIQNSHFAKGLGKTIQSLTPLQQAQLRYNVLLEDVVPISGLAVKSLDTVEGSLVSQEYSWIQLQKQLGSGSNIIETKVNLALAKLYDLLSLLPKSILSTAGFFADFGGRALQVIGIIVQLSFEISLLATSIGALNVLLKNQTIQKFFISISGSSFFLREVNSTFDQLIVNIGKAFNTIGTKGLGITSFFTLLSQIVKVAISQVIALFLALTPYVAIFAAIASAGYILYEALTRIENETHIFSNTWKAFLDFLNNTGVFNKVSTVLNEIINLIALGIKYAISIASNAILSFINLTNDIRINIIKLQAIIGALIDTGINYLSDKFIYLNKIYQNLVDSFKKTDFYKNLVKLVNDLGSVFTSLEKSIANFIDNTIKKFEKFLNTFSGIGEKIKGGVLNLIGVNQAYGAENENVVESIQKIINSHGTLSKEQIAYVLKLKNSSQVTDSFAKSLKESNYQLIQEQLQSRKSGSIIDQVVTSKRLLSKADLENIANLEKSNVQNDKALVLINNKIFAIEKDTANTIKNSKANKESVDAIISKSQATDALNNAYNALKLSALEQIEVNFATNDIRQALDALDDKLGELNHKIHKAKQDELPDLIKEIKKIQEKAIEIKLKAILSDISQFITAFTGGAKDIIKATGKLIGTTIGTAIAGPLGSMIGDIVGQLIDIFGQAPEKFQKMIEDALAGIPQILANIVQNLLITLPEALYQGILKIIDQLPALTDAIITSIVQKFSDPSFVVAMAIGITKAWIKAIPNIASGIVKGITNGLTKGLFGRLEKVGKSLEDVAKVFNGIGKFFAGVFKTIKDNLKYLLIPLIVVFSPLIIAIGILYLTIKNFDKIVQFFANIVRFAIDFFRNLPQFIIDSLTSIPRLIFEGFVTAFNFITVGLQNFMNALINGFQAVLTFLKSLPALLLQGITSGFTLIINALTNLLNAIPQAAIKFTDQVWKGAVNFGNKILDGVDLFVKRLFKGADDFVGAIVRGAGQFISELIKGIGKAGSSLLPNLPGGNLLNQAGNAINNAVNTVQEFVDDITSWSTGGIPALTAARGMIVPGNSTQGDRIPVRVNSREMILNLDQQARLFKMLQGQMNSNSESRPIEIHTTVQLDNRQLGKSIERLTLNGWQK